VNQPKRLENCKILIANTPMDTDKVKVLLHHAHETPNHVHCHITSQTTTTAGFQFSFLHVVLQPVTTMGFKDWCVISKHVLSVNNMSAKGSVVYYK
jgi:hypothetical protein